MRGTGSWLRAGPVSATTAVGRAAWTACALALAALAVFVSTLLGAHQYHHPTFNPIDEQAHLDYAVYLSHGRVPRWGDLYSSETVHILNCVGIARAEPAPCITNTDPRRYAPAGYSYEAQQPPLAYLLYVPFLNEHASAPAALAAARRGSVAWLAIAAVLLVAMAALADMNLLQTALVLAVCELSPWAVLAGATVTNDSAALAAGAASVVTVQIGRRLRSPVVVAALLVGAGVGLLKAVFCVAPLALVVGGMLSERAAFAKGFDLAALWRRRGCELSLLIGAVVATVVFALVQELRAVVPSKVVLHALLGFRTTARPRWATFEGSIQNAVTAFESSPRRPLFTLWNLLVYGSVLGVVVNRAAARGRGLRALGVGIFTALVVVAVGFPLLDFFQGHFNFAAPARYDLVLVPLLAYVAARSLRPALVAVVGIVVPVLTVVSTLFGHPN